MKALVIDDSRAMRLILKRTMVQLGFEVSEAGDGQAGLDSLRSVLPDVVLVDWNMPVMNGLDFVLAVRADADLGAVPIVMVTSESDFGQVDRALEAGADEYVMKPFDSEAIEAKLRLVGVLS